MCGIVGVMDRRAATSAEALTRDVRLMTDRLRHRGPDGQGVWTDPAAGIALGHRRLAIIDLSEAGHQPMVSRDGRFIISFNGEIYNFPEIRAELLALGCSFRGQSDTEVLLEACAAWGLAETLPRLVGMFAFALWDREQHVLALARDAAGIKPLYWGSSGSTFLFASELSALAMHPGFEAEVDRSALSCYLRFGYVPSPGAIYVGTSKLPPGHYLILAPNQPPRTICYWDSVQVAGSALQAGRDLDPAAALETLETLLRDSVARQMVSDVPLGAFLSGGTDSSLVVALMQAQSRRPVQTFTIGFTEPKFDEAPFARAIAAHLGTEHTEIYVSPADVLAVTAQMPATFDEPFADASQIPTLILSEMTRKHVTVALSGDGGDELFAGYDHYRLLARLWRYTRWMPGQAQKMAAAALHRLPELRSRGAPLATGQAPRAASRGERLSRIADLLPAAQADDLYRHRYSHWSEPDRIVIAAEEYRWRFWDDHSPALPDFIDRMQLLDQTTYMTDDVLPKVDRASMAVSLEVRVPLLDQRLMAFSWRLPQTMKLRGTAGKWALREILSRYVPPALTERPKQGFNPPVAQWLRGPLRDWGEAQLSPERLRRDGLLETGAVRGLWDNFQQGRAAPWDEKRLWDVLMFQAWFEHQRGTRQAARSHAAGATAIGS